MRPFIRTIDTLELDGGTLCLNFVNSVKSRFENPLYEFILSPEDWLLWCRRTQLCADSLEKQLFKYVSEDQDKARRELKRIIRIREVLYRIFQKIAQKEPPLTEDIRSFNNELSFSFRYLSIKIDEKSEISPTWSYRQTDLMLTLLPIMNSAYDLLTSDSKDRVKECLNCGWLYLDKSKSNSRVWCNMKTCGNTIKINKYYEKNKALVNKDKSSK